MPYGIYEENGAKRTVIAARVQTLAAALVFRLQGRELKQSIRVRAAVRSNDLSLRLRLDPKRFCWDRSATFDCSSRAFFAADRRSFACVFGSRGLASATCSVFLVTGGRRPASMAPDLTVELKEDPMEAFKMLIRSAGSKSKPALSSKFVKKMEEIPSLELSPEDPCSLGLLLAEKALIGKFTGLWPSPKTVGAWMEDRWKMLVQGEVSLCAVGRGFFVFRFSRKEDRDLVFRSGPYFMGSRGLFLAPWTLDFNPGDEITAAPVWVRLPHLPLHLWGMRTLEDIGNKIGRFLDRAEPKGDQFSCARICVEVNLEKGLPEAIKLSLGEWCHIQELDYEQIPFKCLRCHDYGHFAKSCPKAPEEPGPVKEDDFQLVTNRRRQPRRKDPLAQAPKATHSVEATLENKNSFDALKEDEALDPEATAVKEDPPADESLPDPTPPDSVAARETRASAPKPSAFAGLAVLVPSSGSVETSEPEDNLVPSPPLTRGRKTNKVRREKEAASNISLGSQKKLDPFIKGIISLP